MCIIHSLIDTIKSDVNRHSEMEGRWICRIDLLKPVMQIIQSEKSDAQAYFMDFLKLSDMRLVTYQAAK